MSAKGRTKRPKAAQRIRAAIVAAKERAANDLTDTVHGRRWRGYIAANAWTLDTIPADKLAQLVGVVSKAAAAALLATTWDAIAARLGVDAAVRASALRTMHARAPRQRVSVVERAEKERARLDAFTAKRKAEQDAAKRATDARPLVDDRALAVRLDTLPIGTRFKLPDDVRLGVRGDASRLLWLGSGSATISKTPRLGDYIARASMVVPLAQDGDA